MPVLRFDNVSKHYAGGRQALSEVTFEVDAGEMLFITGHSGAGKSTLLKLIHLSERASRGAVLFNERNLRNVRGRQVAMHRREVGVVFQDHRLLADRSVADNVGLPLLRRGTARAEIGKRPDRAVGQGNFASVIAGSGQNLAVLLLDNCDRQAAAGKSAGQAEPRRTPAHDDDVELHDIDLCGRLLYPIEMDQIAIARSCERRESWRRQRKPGANRCWRCDASGWPPRRRS